MKTRKYFLIAALLGTVLAGCQKVEEEIQTPEQRPETSQTENTGNKWKLIIRASKGIDTKALSLVTDTELKFYWTNGEKVDVFYNNGLLTTLTASNANGTTADLSGEFDRPDGMNDGAEIFLLFPGRDDPDPDAHLWTYEGQDGSAPSESGTMATRFDYASTSLTLSFDDANHEATATGSTVFASQQSIYRLGFKVGGTGDAIAINSFTVTSNQNMLVRSLAYSSGVWTPTHGSLTLTPTVSPADNIYWMAIRNDNTTLDDTYTFMVIGDGNAVYEGTKTIPAGWLGNNQFLSGKSINVSKKAFAPNNSNEVETVDVL